MNSLDLDKLSFVSTSKQQNVLKGLVKISKFKEKRILCYQKYASTSQISINYSPEKYMNHKLNEKHFKMFINDKSRPLTEDNMCDQSIRSFFEDADSYFKQNRRGEDVVAHGLESILEIAKEKRMKNIEKEIERIITHYTEEKEIITMKEKELEKVEQFLINTAQQLREMELQCFKDKIILDNKLISLNSEYSKSTVKNYERGVQTEFSYDSIRQKEVDLKMFEKELELKEFLLSGEIEEKDKSLSLKEKDLQIKQQNLNEQIHDYEVKIKKLEQIEEKLGSGIKNKFDIEKKIKHILNSSYEDEETRMFEKRLEATKIFQSSPETLKKIILFLSKDYHQVYDLSKALGQMISFYKKQEKDMIAERENYAYQKDFEKFLQVEHQKFEKKREEIGKISRRVAEDIVKYGGNKRNILNRMDNESVAINNKEINENYNEGFLDKLKKLFGNLDFCYLKEEELLSKYHNGTVLPNQCNCDQKDKILEKKRKDMELIKKVLVKEAEYMEAKIKASAERAPDKAGSKKEVVRGVKEVVTSKEQIEITLMKESSRLEKLVYSELNDEIKKELQKISRERSELKNLEDKVNHDRASLLKKYEIINKLEEFYRAYNLDGSILGDTHLLSDMELFNELNSVTNNNENNHYGSTINNSWFVNLWKKNKNHSSLNIENRVELAKDLELYWEGKSGSLLKLTLLHATRRWRLLQTFAFYKFCNTTLRIQNAEYQGGKYKRRLNNRSITPQKWGGLQGKKGGAVQERQEVQMVVEVKAEEPPDHTQRYRAGCLLLTHFCNNTKMVNTIRLERSLLIWRKRSLDVEKRTINQELNKISMALETTIMTEQQTKIRILNEKNELESKLNELLNLIIYR